MDFRRLGGASFKIWTYYCNICKKREGGIGRLENRFLKGGGISKIAQELDYNPQTVSQAIHTLKDAGFLTEIRDPIDHRKYAYFLHVILMGEYIELPKDPESMAMRAIKEELVAA